jgi:LPS-assembly lipoprotein
MWWPDISARQATRQRARFSAILLMAGLTAGCFQPLYGDRIGANGGNSIVTAMRGVDVSPLNTPRGTRLDRIGVEVRNNLIFGLTGGSGGSASTHRLVITISSSQQQIIVDIASGRPDVQNYTLNATYVLTDLATGKPVVNTITFAAVSYNLPGQQQRFAGERGLRDAEDRAAQVIADNIRTRLASYFTAGT